MTRAQIFMGPGEWIVEFALSLIAMNPSAISPELFKALSIAATLVFWYFVVKIVIAVIRRITGFDHRGPQR